MANGDTGNPNVFTTFKGRYQVTVADGASYDSTAVMLSCVNDVIFMGNASSNQDGLIMTLPPDCTPNENVTVPCGSGDGVLLLTVGADGSISGQPNTMYHSNGISFNISGNFYR